MSTNGLKKKEKAKRSSFHLSGGCSYGDSLQKSMQLQTAPFALLASSVKKKSYRNQTVPAIGVATGTQTDQIQALIFSAWPSSACCWCQEPCQVYGQDLRCNVQCGPCCLHCSRKMGNARYEPDGRLRAEELSCSLGLHP